MRLPLTIHTEGTLQFADLQRLRRTAIRTTALRAALATALVATLAGIVLLARGAGAGRAAVLPAGATTGCIALDMSGSISGAKYARIATTLTSIVKANEPICLVMFADSAYELLPPNSPPDALLQLIAFFTPMRHRGGVSRYMESPWNDFSGGTRISTGVVAAEQALHRAGVKHGAILLVSDLDDWPADLPALDAEALRLREEHLPVRIAPLFPRPFDREYFAQLFGRHAFVDPSTLRRGAHERVQPVAAPANWGVLTLGVVLVLLLFGNERWNTRLHVKAAG